MSKYMVLAGAVTAAIVAAVFVNSIDKDSILAASKRFMLEESEEAVLFKKMDHNQIECSAEKTLSEGPGLKGVKDVNYFVYEYTGEEPPFKGKFRFASSMIERTPGLSKKNTLEKVLKGNVYYIRTDKDLVFDCSTGVFELEKKIEEEREKQQIEVDEVKTEETAIKDSSQIASLNTLSLKPMAIKNIKRIEEMKSPIPIYPQRGCAHKLELSIISEWTAEQINTVPALEQWNRALAAKYDQLSGKWEMFAYGNRPAGFLMATVYGMDEKNSKSGVIDLTIANEQNQKKTIYLPCLEKGYTSKYWISEDGSSYKSVSNHFYISDYKQSELSIEAKNLERPYPFCQNGRVDQIGEECDDGNTSDSDACKNGCTWGTASCGDGITSPDEECEDGNPFNFDECTNSCRKAACGDGFVQTLEEYKEYCDDGNTAANDGCGSDCRIEPGYDCKGKDPSVCAKTACGNGIAELGEQCDDGDTDNLDGCDSQCRMECGNGKIEPTEQCDDGNYDSKDGCSKDCKWETWPYTIESCQKCKHCGLSPKETNYYNSTLVQALCRKKTCESAGQQCEFTQRQADMRSASINSCEAKMDLCRPTWKCGDGAVSSWNKEQCDDGNTQSGDGCDSQCKKETKIVECPPPPSCAEPELAPGCTLKPPAKDANGCITGCGGIECLEVPYPAIDLPPQIQVQAQGQAGTSSNKQEEYCMLGMCPQGQQCLTPSLVLLCSSEECKENANCKPLILTGPQSCKPIKCASGKEYPKCDTNGNPVNYAIDPCTVSAEPACGNGKIDEGEECDDWNTYNNDGCDSQCKSDCGNGRMDNREQCDDGNRRYGDGCNLACLIEESPYGCGNGKIDMGEKCDDGNKRNDDGCSFTCTIEDRCGNGKVEQGEECDDGNKTDGDGCSSKCKKIASTIPVCGNGKVDEGEECDDRNKIGGDGCSGSCRKEKPIIPFCGNRRVDSGEECDDGNTTDADGCSTNCKKVTAKVVSLPPIETSKGWISQNPSVPSASLIDGGTDSDIKNGNADWIYANTGWNNISFTPLPSNAKSVLLASLKIRGEISAGSISVKIVSRPTDPTKNDVDLTSPAYIKNLGTVRIGQDAPETTLILPVLPEHKNASDWTNILAKFGFSGDLRLYAIDLNLTLDCGGECNSLGFICGNGTLDPREECDNGTLNSDTEPDSCRTNCRKAHPGDGVIDTGEECDDGNTVNGDGCDYHGKKEICGNSRIEGLEECDDGNTTDQDGCSSKCLRELCGNTRIDPGEECDDGNISENDGCTEQCLKEYCGNGKTEAEDCDDGDKDDADACKNDCTWGTASCGDGYKSPGEQCDDGNRVNRDGCNIRCLIEGCGNNVIELGEECDDGNISDKDGCSPSCKNEEIPTGNSELCSACPDTSNPEKCSKQGYCFMKHNYPSAYGECKPDNICNTYVIECGNGVLDERRDKGYNFHFAEQCDDGNKNNGDGCNDKCYKEICGNGRVDEAEECDDGNNFSEQGICNSDCTINKERAAAACGNGVEDPSEPCDGGDACSENCTFEDGRMDKSLIGYWNFNTNNHLLDNLAGGKNLTDTSLRNSGDHAPTMFSNVNSLTTAKGKKPMVTTEKRFAIDKEELTVSLWVKTSSDPQDLGAYVPIEIGYLGNYEKMLTIQLFKDGKAAFSDASPKSGFVGTTKESGLVTSDEWHHIAVVVGRKGVPWKQKFWGPAGIYIDGQEKDLNLSNIPNPGSVYKDIRFGDSSTDDPLQIDDVRIYNRVLNDDTIKKLSEGNAPDCGSGSCDIIICGNANIESGEECDDGNQINTDYCVDCRKPYCGDGFVKFGYEGCDDGNTESGDGCSPGCEREPSASADFRLSAS